MKKKIIGIIFSIILLFFIGNYSIATDEGIQNTEGETNNPATSEENNVENGSGNATSDEGGSGSENENGGGNVSGDENSSGNESSNGDGGSVAESNPEPAPSGNDNTQYTSGQYLSNNANLSNLGIRPNDFTGFNPSTTEYNVTVENDVTSVEVYATAQNSKAKIIGTGIRNLNEGNNVLSVTVTAENGNNKTYTINVERKTADEEKTEENSGEKPLGLSELKIEGLELKPTFKSDVYEYTVNYIGKNTKLNIIAKSNNEGETVEIAGNENLTIGDNLVNIIVTDSTGENTVTYQLTVNKKLEDEEALANKIKEEEQRRNTKRAIVIGTVLIIVLVIVIIILIKKARDKRLSEEYSSPYYEDDEEDINEYDDEYYEEDDTNNYFDDIEEQEELEDEEETTTKIKKKKVKGKRFK